MKKKALQEHWLDLKNVTTLAQALRDYHVSKTGLIYAIDVERVAAIRVGHSVLISIRSLDAAYPRRRTTVR